MNKDKLLTRFHIKEKLRFDFEKCHISLEDNRMMLLHLDAFASLRDELFSTLDQRQAQGILLRMGFTSGQLDADVALKLYGSGDNFDVFDLGPGLHGLEGFVDTTITEYDIDWEKGSFYGKVECRESAEAEAYLSKHSNSNCPVCWSIVGYASGYVSRFFKRFIVFKEISCKACGHEFCTLEGKPVEAWGDDSYINYFRDDYNDSSPVEAELNLLRGSVLPTVSQDQGDLLGRSPAFINAFNLLSQASRSPINVLLQGETGVGKELFARWLHNNSQRADKPFIAINCGAIPNDLIEAELFGVKRGAYTGASESRPGRFELADGGTLFLDELGELTASAQVKLLRVLQTGELERLGDSKTIKVDVRLVAATNVNLQKAIHNGDFRSDLFYRIATYPIQIPPLRERKSDIPILVESMLKKYTPLYNKTIKGITDNAMQALHEYSWPGNIRELQNIIERAILLAPDNGLVDQIHVVNNTEPQPQYGNSIPAYPSATDTSENIYDDLVNSNLSLEQHEIKLLESALQKTEGNMTKAAKLLGITRRQLAYKLKKSPHSTHQ